MYTIYCEKSYHVNFLLIFNEETPSLLNQPKKCVDYIMHICHVSRRTAYDYYTALLYINYHPKLLERVLSEQLGVMAQALEKGGIDPSKTLKVK